VNSKPVFGAVPRDLSGGREMLLPADGEEINGFVGEYYWVVMVFCDNLSERCRKGITIKNQFVKSLLPEDRTKPHLRRMK